MNIWIKWLVALVSLSSNVALAASATGSLTVTATVSDSCSVGTSSINFNTYNPISGSDHPATGAVSVTCTTGTGYSIELGTGSNSASCSNNRCMKDAGTDYLIYELYKDAGYTQIWGGSAYGAGNAKTGLTGNGIEQLHDVYGVITAGRNVPKGSYSDTVTITISY